MFIIISLLVVFICIYNEYFSKNFYYIALFIIGLSLLLLMPLRTDHLLGVDIHQEYYLFQVTATNLKWSAILGSTLDSCISISLLPTIFQLAINSNPEFLFKILFSLIFSIMPLILFSIFNQYVNNFYAFLASCFFLFQKSFIFTEFFPRTYIALIFFSLVIFLIFNPNIEMIKKKVLIILFFASCIFSHYATTYIFLILLIGTYLLVYFLSVSFNFSKGNKISLDYILIFAVLIFIWYSLFSQPAAFTSGVNFIDKSAFNLQYIFEEEMKSSTAHSVLGDDLLQKNFPQKIEFIYTWLTFTLIGIGIIAATLKIKEYSYSSTIRDQSLLYVRKIDIEYYCFAICSAILLVAIVVLPFISVGYGIDRLFIMTNVILAIFFIIGGVFISEKINKIIEFNQKKYTINRFLEIKPYIIILLILIPYFLSISGFTYQIAGNDRSILLNNKGEQFESYFVSDQESNGAKWLSIYANKKEEIFADRVGILHLMSQGSIKSKNFFSIYTSPDEVGDSYLYYRDYNIASNEFVGLYHIRYDLESFSEELSYKNSLYSNGKTIITK